MAAKQQTRGTPNELARGEAPAKPAIYRRYASKRLTGRVCLGDALAFMQSLDSQSAQIVFLDPPFNLGKVYGAGGCGPDLRPETEYRQWMREILDEGVRTLDDGGALYLYHLPIWNMRFGAYLENKLTFRHWIAISMKNGFVRGKRLYPAHYSLLMFTKGLPKTFNRPKTYPAECRHCGKYIKDYGGYKSIIEEKGINLSDFWEDVSPVRHARRKTRPANELPKIIFDRVIQMSSEPDFLYVDPFAGSGGGVLAATKAGMRFAACDAVSSNCQLIVKRLDDLAKTGLCGEQPGTAKPDTISKPVLGISTLVRKGA